MGEEYTIHKKQMGTVQVDTLDKVTICNSSDRFSIITKPLCPI